MREIHSCPVARSLTWWELVQDGKLAVNRAPTTGYVAQCRHVVHARMPVLMRTYARTQKWHVCARMTRVLPVTDVVRAAVRQRSGAKSQFKKSSPPTK